VSGFSSPDVAKSVNDGEPASSAATNTARHGASRACQASPSAKANVSVSPSSMGVRKYSRVTPMAATSSTNHAGCVYTCTRCPVFHTAPRPSTTLSTTRSVMNASSLTQACSAQGTTTPSASKSGRAQGLWREGRATDAAYPVLV
jgi:hypothetical protein